jgi:putative transposase
MNAERQPQRRRPAHFAPVQRFNAPVIVQVNVSTKDRRPALAFEAGHRLFRDTWEAADFWRVGAYVIMPDHVHLFCAPGRDPAPSLRQWVEYWKSRIAAQWPTDADGTATDVTEAVRPECGDGGSPSVATGRTDDTEVVPPGRTVDSAHGGSASVRTARFKLWQRDFWDTQMRSREHYEEKLSYVRMNPLRKGLAQNPEDWPYQGVIHEIGWV